MINNKKININGYNMEKMEIKYIINVKIKVVQ